MAAIVASAVVAQAVTIDSVPVGNPGNANDTHAYYGYGGVDYAYRIGKYEVTNAQWREFLTAKAGVSDPYGLYNTDMAETYGGIDRTWSVDHYVYSAKGGDANWDNRPVNYVSFWDAARFCNWLHNGQGSGDTETGAYINIGNQTTFARQTGAQYFIPTENEWYKAAYHKNDGVTGNYFDYPIGSDIVPSNDLIAPDPGNNANFYVSPSDYTIGSPYYATLVGDFENSASAYGTFDQGGNVWEWNESILYSSLRGLRGGYYGGISDYLAASYRNGNNPSYEVDGTGFRVASVPEPGSIALLVSGAVAGLIWWKRRKTMFEKSLFRLSAALVAVALLATTAQAVTIETVPVGNPGNADDTHGTGYGGVAYSYRIGTYEVTNAQWREFLTAKASVSDPYGLYNPNMALSGGIDCTWSVDHYVYSAKDGDANWDNRPVNWVGFWDAARFCNWLHNGQGSGVTETGAYINIGNQTTFARQAGAQYFIPTENEWYKAAYHKNDGVTGNYWDYPTRSDTAPINTLLTPDPGNHANFNDLYGTGNGGFTIDSPYYTTVVGDFENSASAYGTFDQGGNLWEWNETPIGPERGLRGGYWLNGSNDLRASNRPDVIPPENSLVGFRVASVPEPGSIALLVSGAVAGLIWWKRRR